MKRIAIASHKGGVGKTTTAVNLASALSDNYKVLIIDADSQGNATSSLGIDTTDKYTLADFIVSKDLPVSDVIYKTGVNNLDIMPSDLSLMVAQDKIASKPAKEFILRQKLDKFNDYDFMIIDCPPSFSLVTINALLSVDYVILPCNMTHFAYHGICSFMEMFDYIN